jgi:hypothetical protein
MSLREPTRSFRHWRWMIAATGLFLGLTLLAADAFARGGRPGGGGGGGGGRPGGGAGGRPGAGGGRFGRGPGGGGAGFSRFGVGPRGGTGNTARTAKEWLLLQELEDRKRKIQERRVRLQELDRKEHQEALLAEARASAAAGGGGVA